MSEKARPHGLVSCAFRPANVFVGDLDHILGQAPRSRGLLDRSLVRSSSRTRDHSTNAESCEEEQAASTTASATAGHAVGRRSPPALPAPVLRRLGLAQR